MEELAVLHEESVAQPVLQRAAFKAHRSQQFILPGRTPGLAVSLDEQLAQAVGGGLLAAHGRDADDAVLVHALFKAIVRHGRSAGDGLASLARPAVPEQ